MPKLLPPNYRGNEINLSQLLVSVNDFPSDWKTNGNPEPAKGDEFDWGEENIVARFQTINDQDFADQYVYKFRNEASAKYGLFWIKQQGFLTPPENALLPEEWKYQSLIADEWIFGCSVGKICTLIARYDELIVRFIVSLNSNYMNVGDLENLFRSIDEKVGIYLENG